MYNIYIIKVKELLCVRYSTNEAPNKFVEIIDIAKRKAVAIDKGGRSVSMIVAKGGLWALPRKAWLWVYCKNLIRSKKILWKMEQLSGLMLVKATDL